MATQIFFIFTPTWGNDPIWRAYFAEGLKPPTSDTSLLVLFVYQKIWVCTIQIKHAQMNRVQSIQIPIQSPLTAVLPGELAVEKATTFWWTIGPWQKSWHSVPLAASRPHGNASWKVLLNLTCQNMIHTPMDKFDFWQGTWCVFHQDPNTTCLICSTR